MVKISSIVDLSEAGCTKPGCKHRFTVPNRHHTRHEKTWINLWERVGPPTFRGDKGLGRRMALKLKERYYQFRAQDVVRICEWHHAEIHDLYRDVMAEAYLKFRKQFKERFSYEEAAWVMMKCRLLCLDWLEKETPGYDPKKARRAGKW